MASHDGQIAIFEDQISDDEHIEEPQLQELHNDFSEDERSDIGSAYEHAQHDEGYSDEDAGYAPEHNVSDPFSSDLSNGRPHGNRVRTRAPNGYNRNVSITTAKLLADRAHPHHNFSEDDENAGHVEAPYDDTATYGGSTLRLEPESRKVSDTLSTLPDELEYYRSTLPGRSPLSLSRGQHGSRPGSATHEQAGSPMRGSRQYRHQSSVSTPLAVPLPYSPTHSRSNSAMRQDSRPVFRNPSSVRAMQLSSPSLRSGSPSPLSHSHTRNSTTIFGGPAYASPSRNREYNPQSRAGTPSRHTPSRHPNPRKEYPLVLLHCTLSALPLPAMYPPEAFEAVGAMEQTKKDAVLLNQRMNATITDRGVLIQHPGDDYELLEERVLESLELRRPRVGGCGHFRSTSSVSNEGDDTSPKKHTLSTDSDPANHDLDKGHRCVDCTRTISSTLLPEDERDALRRWDIRIYAANGLMRAGAWSAAWKEMEKVDVEVGVWVSDNMRSKLEAWAANEEDKAARARQDAEMANAAPSFGCFDGESEARTRPTIKTAAEGLKGRERARAATNDHSPASRAATSRPGSRHKAPFEALHHTSPPLSASIEDQYSSAFAQPEPASSSQTPLTTLIYNYILRTTHRYKDTLLPIFVLILALAFASRSLFSSSSAPAMSALPSAGIGSNPAEFGFSHSPSTPRAAGDPTSVQISGQSIDAEAIIDRVQLAACTLPPSALETGDGAPGAEMAVVPKAVARRVLKGMVDEELKEVVEENEDGEKDDGNEAGTSGEDGRGIKAGEDDTVVAKGRERGGFMARMGDFAKAVADDGDIGEAVDD